MQKQPAAELPSVASTNILAELGLEELLNEATAEEARQMKAVFDHHQVPVLRCSFQSRALRSTLCALDLSFAVFGSKAQVTYLCNQTQATTTDGQVHLPADGDGRVVTTPPWLGDPSHSLIYLLSANSRQIEL
eukprot:SAG31_NODE_1864_length_7036_cov_3.477584_5_plen_133_part_00